MTADDLQENRRVCKFPCTSPGEGPAPGRQLRGGRGKRRVGVPFTARTRRRKPAADPRCAAAGGAPAGRPARAKPGRPAAVPASCTYFPKRSSPGFPRATPPAGSCVGQGQAAGRRPVYSPYKAQEAGRRPPLRSSGGRPAGAPCPGEARAACGRIFPLHRPAQRGEALPPRAQQQRLQLLAPQGSLQRSAGQRKLGAEAGRLFQRVILPEGHKIVVLPAQQRPQSGRTAA